MVLALKSVERPLDVFLIGDAFVSLHTKTRTEELRFIQNSPAQIHHHNS